ncbi:MAG: PD-(D/E)XK nuclease family protein [Candidatus Niyogibacteria bacterium]|nr:PD-(D/E)XK nuclease family protein [Candidatus Niyogibacteria bacterium]
MRISYTALETYKTCPLKYKFSEIDKIRGVKSKEAVFGTLLHSALKHMFSRDPLYPTLDEVVNFYLSGWAQYAPKVPWSDEREEKMFREQGIEILKRFYASNQPWNFNVVDLESRFELPLEDTKTGVTHTLAGIMDRIDKPDDNTYEIIDYKTSKRMPSQEKADANLQLSIYHMGLTHRWPHLKDKTIRLSLHFLKHNEKITTARSAEHLRETRESIISTIREIEAKKTTSDFEPIPSPLCDWCGYRPMCPVWKHLYTKDEKTPDADEIKAVIHEYLELKAESQKNTKRIKELYATLANYMQKENLLRVFAPDGSISRTIKTAVDYDLDGVRAILESIGKWNEILKADERKLAALIPSLPPEVQEKIAAFATPKITETLTVSRKKLAAEPDEVES